MQRRADLLASGRLGELVEDYFYPLVRYLGDQQKVVEGPGELIGIFKELQLDHTARGVTHLVAAVSAMDLPRHGRFRAWVSYLEKAADAWNLSRRDGVHCCRDTEHGIVSEMLEYQHCAIPQIWQKPKPVRKVLARRDGQAFQTYVFQAILQARGGPRGLAAGFALVMGGPMGIIDQTKIAPRLGSIYPSPYAEMMAGRSSLRLGDAGGLTQFGANLVMLAPGALSSLRHWHQNEDEFVMVTEGECVLVQDAGEVLMRVGDCAAFPAGSTDGHHFLNRTVKVAKFLVVGTRAKSEVATYSDVDMVVHMAGGKAKFTYKDGSDWSGPR